MSQASFKGFVDEEFGVPLVCWCMGKVCLLFNALGKLVGDGRNWPLTTLRLFAYHEDVPFEDM